MPNLRLEGTEGDFDKLVAVHLDIANPSQVEIDASDDHKVIWVNVDGVCVLRICMIQNLIIKGGL